MDLKRVRESDPGMVLLRKDFIFDAYQLHEALAYGADMVLLIAANLEQREVSDLSLEARSLGLSVLFEVHSEDEMEKYHPAIEYVGVNNRNLKTFETTLDTTRTLSKLTPADRLIVSESGLSTPDDLADIARYGVRCFLIGESLMRKENVMMATRMLLNSPLNARGF